MLARKGRNVRPLRDMSSHRVFPRDDAAPRVGAAARSRVV